MAAFGVVIGLFYLGFIALMIGGWIYLLMKVSEISRNVGVIAGQQEQHSHSLASLAESVAVLARNSAAQRSEPPVPVVP
jgi:uncharacterized metal-binding protein